MSRASRTSTSQNNLFQSRLSQQLNPRHPLFLLTQIIDWDGLEGSLGLTFSPDKAGPARQASSLDCRITHVAAHGGFIRRRSGRKMG